MGKRINQLIKESTLPAERPDFKSEELLKEIKDDQLRYLIWKMLQKDPKKYIKSKRSFEGIEND